MVAEWSKRFSCNSTCAIKLTCICRNNYISVVRYKMIPLTVTQLRSFRHGFLLFYFLAADVRSNASLIDEEISILKQ